MRSIYIQAVAVVMALLVACPAAADDSPFDMADCIGPRLADLAERRDGCTVIPDAETPPYDAGVLELETVRGTSATVSEQPFEPAKPQAPAACPVAAPPADNEPEIAVGDFAG